MSGNVGMTAITLKRTGLPDSIVGDLSAPVMSGGTNVFLRFTTTSGYKYGVKATDNLVSGTWSNIVTDVAGTGGDVIITNTRSEDVAQRFYRAYLQE
jgi:hypothetical protein